MNVAIIPARGGSKRIPRKNVRDFAGKPMIGWSIAAAFDSGCFDRVVVSTDDDEIADIASGLGASVPFRRPPELSDDFTPTTPVVAHAIRWLQQDGMQPQQVCCLYATAPFIRADDIRAGLSALEDSGADYAFSVTSFEFPIQRAVKIDRNGRLAMFQPEHFATRSQDLEPAYHDAGQFYWGRASAWLDGQRMFGPQAVPVILPRYRVQDIDTIEDWMRAELMAASLGQR